MSSSGLSLSLCVFAFSILCTTSSPLTARPKIVCLLSSHGYKVLATFWVVRKIGKRLTVFSVVMKN